MRSDLAEPVAAGKAAADKKILAEPKADEARVAAPAGVLRSRAPMKMLMFETVRRGKGVGFGEVGVAYRIAEGWFFPGVVVQGFCFVCPGIAPSVAIAQVFFIWWSSICQILGEPQT